MSLEKRIQRFYIFYLYHSLRTTYTELQSFPSPWNQKNNAECDISKMGTMPVILTELMFFCPLRTVVCAVPHNAGCAEPGMPGAAEGASLRVVRPGPTRGSDGNIPQPPATGVKIDGTFTPISLVLLGPTQAPFHVQSIKLTVQGSGQENVTRSLIWAHLEEKGGAENANSLRGWSSAEFIKFSAHFGERG